MNKTQKKIANINQFASQFEYVKSEFNERLFGSCPDGDVTLEQMLEFIDENEGLLEMILDLSKQLKQINQQ